MLVDIVVWMYDVKIIRIVVIVVGDVLIVEGFIDSYLYLVVWYGWYV